MLLKWAGSWMAKLGEWQCGEVRSPATLAAQTLETLKCTQLVHFIAQNSYNKRTHYYLGPLSFFFFFPTTVGSWKWNRSEIGNWEIRTSVGGLWGGQRESSSSGPVPGAFYRPPVPETSKQLRGRHKAGKELAFLFQGRWTGEVPYQPHTSHWG